MSSAIDQSTCLAAEASARDLIDQLAVATSAINIVLLNLGVHGVAPQPARTVRASINSHQLTKAFEQVKRVENRLKSAPGNPPQQLEKAVAHYRSALRQFKLLLPKLQGWLLTERSRLGSRQAHSASVEGWMKSNRQTR
jgi:hypothetical protein